jgi:hypothetical protein
MKREVAFVVSVIAALLGLMWLLQGLGVVHLRPILCFADCEPIQSTSPTWTAIGAVIVIVAALGILYSLKRSSVLNIDG